MSVSTGTGVASGEVGGDGDEIAGAGAVGAEGMEGLGGDGTGGQGEGATLFLLLEALGPDGVTGGVGALFRGDILFISSKSVYLELHDMITPCIPYTATTPTPTGLSTILVESWSMNILVNNFGTEHGY